MTERVARNALSLIYDNYMIPHGITIRKLSDLCGIPRSRLSKLFDGRSPLRPDEFQKISDTIDRLDKERKAT